MDAVQHLINAVMYPEEVGSVPGHPSTHAAEIIGQVFEEDLFNRNMRVDQLELEVRMGKAPEGGRRGPFTAAVPEALFNTFITGMQLSHAWSEPPRSERVIVGYFENIDDSVRLHVASDGTETLISKQKLGIVDVRVDNAPLDFRVAASLEIPMTSHRRRAFALAKATRTVIRDRTSFRYGNFCYDMTCITEQDGTRTHMVELELVNPSSLQIKGVGAQAIAVEMERRIVDLISISEPVGQLRTRVVRTRWY